MVLLKLGLLSVLLLFLTESVQCLKILGVFPLPSKSHYILTKNLMRALAEKGHEVTVISPFGEKDPPKNGTYLDILLTQEDPEAGGNLKKIIECRNFL